MLHFEVDHDRCLRSRGVKVFGNDCKNCVGVCPMKIVGVKDNKITVSSEVLQKKCIFCTHCLTACLVDEDVIKVWDDENPQLTSTPSILKRLVQYP